LTLETSAADTSAITPPDPRLDDVIVSCATAEWCKVAILIARATDAARAAAIDTTAQAIAARVYALVEDKRLEGQGNVRRWRAGEVRRIAVA
jgi:Protein of unknown function